MTAVLEAPSHIPTRFPTGSPISGRTGGQWAGARPAIPRATGRAVRAVVAAVLLAGTLLVGALVAGSTLTAGAGGPVAEASGEFHRVGPGETLWSIAESLDPSGPRAPVVAMLTELNGGSASVDPGDVIALPELPD